MRDRMELRISGVLDFIQNNRPVDFIQKRMRVGAHTANPIRVFQQVVGSCREEFPEKGGFSGSSGSGQNQGRKAPHGTEDLTFDESGDVVHFDFLNSHFKKLKVFLFGAWGSRRRRR